MRVISGFGEYATSRYFKFVLRCLVRCRYLSLSKRRFTHLIRAFRSFVVWREYAAKSAKEQKERRATYSRLVQHAANFREARETAAEMGKFAVIIRVFYRWRDPLRRRASMLAKLLRRTRIRAYIRAWYLLQRKAYIDRTLPLRAIKGNSGTAAATSASSKTVANPSPGGSYSKHLLAPVAPRHQASPKPFSTQRSHMERTSPKGDAEKSKTAPTRIPALASVMIITPS